MISSPVVVSGTGERQWFWATFVLSSITIIGLVFAITELVEYRFFSHVDYVTLHYLYISRGIASSLLLAFWAAWFVLRERNRMWRKMLEVEKLTSMGEMAAGTAHHLNTPLAALLLRVQMMEERAQDSQLAANLERLEAGIRSCQHFVQRLLEFSRLPPMAKQPAEVASLVEAVVSFLGPSLANKQARLTLALDEARHVQVNADRNLLEALFSILISNALDAIAEEGEINIRCGRPSPALVEIVVADNGRGIADSDMPRIFEPFFTTKKNGKGTGLGLAIARNIAIEHGGSLRLENADAGGVEALLELPVLNQD